MHQPDHQLHKESLPDQTPDQLPPQLNADLNSGRHSFRCTRLLRLLPGKRAVYDAVEGDNRVVIKAFFGPGREKYFSREMAGLTALADAGLPTPGIRGTGQTADNQATLLVLEYLEDSTSLAQQLAGGDAPTQASSPLRNAIDTIARMHRRGIVQQDIHPDNFLVKQGVCYVIDGASIEAPGRLTNSQRLDNLALFCAQIPLITPEQSAAILSDYHDSIDCNPGFTALQLWRKVVAKQRYRNQKFLRKIYRDCTQVKVSRSWHRLTASIRRYDSPALDQLLADPDSFIAQGTLLKDGNSATVALVAVAGVNYVVKRYNIKSFSHWLSRCLRKSRASVSWRNANLMQLLEIATPAPVALIENRWGPLRGTCYFISEHVAAEDLRTLFADLQLSDERRTLVADRFSTLLRKLRLAGISHGDFKATNFLLSRNELVLIDLDACRWHHRRKSFRRAMAKDLSRFMANWEKGSANYRFFAALINHTDS